MKEGFKMVYLPLGTVQTAIVDRTIDTGYVLKKETEEVLLHHNDTVTPLEVGQEVDIFLYNDKNGQVVATTKIPYVTMDHYAWAKVVEVIPRLGVFVNIGTVKEILVSIDNLPLFEDVWPEPGDRLYVALGRDQKNRLLALPATEGIFMNMREFPFDLKLNDKVTGHIYHTDREGSALFTHKGYRAFIHHSEREREPRLGQEVTGRVINIKEDGTINVSLLPLKEERMDKDAETILAVLEDFDGVMPFGDKSDAGEIRDRFDMSKSAFKRALGRLMKQGRVKQEDGQTILIS